MVNLLKLFDADYRAGVILQRPYGCRGHSGGGYIFTASRPRGKRAYLITIALSLVFLLASCAAPSADIMPPEPDVPESYVPSSPSASPVPPVSQTTPGHIPEQDPHDIDPKPPSIPEDERRYLYEPYLVKLEPYTNGSYTDGSNTFVFNDDGTVLCWFSYVYSTKNIHYFVFEKKEIIKPPKPWDIDYAYTGEDMEIKNSDVYKAACRAANDYFLLDERTAGFSHIDFDLVHEDSDNYYLAFEPRTGGGSGESYYNAEESMLARVNADGEILDYGNLKAAHIIWHDGYFYYVELIGGIRATPGIGKVCRIDEDASRRETIVDETVYGTFQITNDRLYYTALADGKAYSVSLNGKDRQPVGSRIAPDYHRVQLGFYGDFIISDFWYYRGYGHGIFVFPSGYVGPAIMDSAGDYLLTFPTELSGYDAYEVVNWSEWDEDDDISTMQTRFLFLKSKADGSYWVYSNRSYIKPGGGIFEYADRLDEYDRE